MLYFIIGLISGLILILPFLFKKKKLEQSSLKKLEEEVNQKKEQLNSLKLNISELEDQKLNLYDTICKRQQEEQNLNQSISELRASKKEIENGIEAEQHLAKQSVQAVYDTARESMEKQLDILVEDFSKKFENCSAEYDEQYNKMLEEYTQDFLFSIEQLQQKIEEAQNALSEEQQKVNTAIEANKREEEKHKINNKYRISLQETDFLEIKRLKDLIPYMRNSRPISKIIWEVYFRQPTNELISRVLGNKSQCGIYKLTNLLDNKVYIGQSVDVAERWKQHIKCGLGIDTPQNNKLYKAMLSSGVENFTFELLEECSRDKLNEEEIYWINFYQSQDYGYNMTKGGSKC